MTLILLYNTSLLTTILLTYLPLYYLLTYYCTYLALNTHTHYLGVGWLVGHAYLKRSA